MPGVDRQTLGKNGEERSALFVQEAGFSIIERNYRDGWGGEIDLIAIKDNLLLFIEVKTRNSNKFGGAAYAISPAKIKRLSLTADKFLRSNPLYNNKNICCRFDLMAIDNDEIEWVKDIIR